MGLFSPSKKKSMLRSSNLRVSQSADNLIRDISEPSTSKEGQNEDNQQSDLISEKNINMSASENSENDSVQRGLDRYTLVINKKRQRTQSNEKAVIPASKKPNRDFVLSTQNKFGSLRERDEGDIKEEKDEKPPPIYLREVISKEFLGKLLEITNKQLYVSPIKRGNINETKIQVRNIPLYRLVVAELEKLEKHFYTYQLKSSKGLVVIIKGIESNTDPNEIKGDLKSQGFEVKNISNVLNSKKCPQPMFRVELEPDLKKLQGNHPIFELKYVLYRRIKIEEPYKRRNIVQCFNCQEYGHTYNYCCLREICVICSGLHESKACPSDKNNSEIKKCSNCGGNHTANYKGCAVYLSLKQKLMAKSKGQEQKKETLHPSFPINKTAYATPDVLYSSYFNKEKKINTNEISENSSDIVKMISALNNNMMKFMQTMENNMSMMLQCMNNLIQMQTKNQK